MPMPVIQTDETQKKRSCTIAVPPTQALVLPFNPNSNTEAHALCIYVRYARTRVHIYVMSILVSQCFGLL